MYGPQVSWLLCAFGELEWIQWEMMVCVSRIRLVEGSDFEVLSILPGWRFRVIIPSRRVRFQLSRIHAIDATAVSNSFPVLSSD